MIRHSLPAYWFGAICWEIVMLWPFNWLHHSPRWLWAWAWLYAEDARQHEKGKA